MWSMAILVTVALVLAALEGVHCALTCNAYDAADKCPIVTISAPTVTTCALQVNTRLGATTTPVEGCDTWTVSSKSNDATTKMTDVKVKVCITNQTISDFKNDEYTSKCRELTIDEETKITISAATQDNEPVVSPFKNYMIPKTCKDGGKDLAFLPCAGSEAKHILVVLKKVDKIVGFASKQIAGLDCTDAVATGAECRRAPITVSGAPLTVSGALLLLVSVTLATLMY